MDVLTVAAPETHYFRVCDGVNGMEPLSTVVVAEVDLRFVPDLLFHVESPEILEVCVRLTSYSDQVLRH